MKIEDILNTFSDINHRYNNSTAYDTLEHMLHQLVEDVSFAASNHIEEYAMGKTNPLPPEDMPEDIIAVTRWGGGNYFLEDRELGKSIRITPDVFWDILEKVHEAMKVAQLNGVEV